jgi:hypothetical protein
MADELEAAGPAGDSAERALQAEQQQQAIEELAAWAVREELAAAETAGVAGATAGGFWPSSWLMTYSLVLLVGGLYLLFTAFQTGNRFPGLTLLAGAGGLSAGVLLWFGQRVGVVMYVLFAIGILAFAGFRWYTDGYSSSRMGMIIGGAMMLAGLGSVLEEVRLRRPLRKADQGEATL